MHIEPQVTIIGGGLAGSEAAWQAAERGASVRLFEMRPVRPTPAHQTANLGEIVCSNSLKTDEPGTAPYLLKEELRRGGSLLIRSSRWARQLALPAASAPTNATLKEFFGLMEVLANASRIAPTRLRCKQRPE